MAVFFNQYNNNQQVTKTSSTTKYKKVKKAIQSQHNNLKPIIYCLVTYPPPEQVSS